MAKHRLSKANQKLYFAAIHLDAVAVAEKDDSLLNQKAMVQANREAALFNLVSAYRGFIWEMCQTHDLEVDAGMTLADVMAKAAQEGKQIQELNHFAQLEKESNGWLNSMLSAYQEVIALDPQGNGKVETVASFNAIEVRKVEETESLEKIFEWHNALKSEIENFRTTLSEW